MSKESETNTPVAENTEENIAVVAEEVKEESVDVKEEGEAKVMETEKESVEEATERNQEQDAENESADAAEVKTAPRRGRPPRKEKASEKINREISEGVVPDYDKRQIINADMDTKRELYQQERVFNPFNMETTSYESELRKEYEFLFAKTLTIPPSPVRGKISGVTTFGDNPMFKVLADGLAGIYKILIPVDEMYECSISAKDEDLEKGMNNWVGANISFCPIKVIEKEKLCFASRLRAMEVQANDNYKKIRRGGTPHVIKGTIVTGNILSVAVNKVIVDACGADVVIPDKELDWIRRGEVYNNEIYKQNNPINIMIQSIEPAKVRTKRRRAEDAYNVMHVEASARLAKENPNKIYWGDYKEGDIVVGRIAYKGERDLSLVLEEKVGAYSGFPEFLKDLNRGDEVKCRIVKMVQEDYFIQVNILPN